MVLMHDITNTRNWRGETKSLYYVITKNMMHEKN